MEIALRIAALAVAGVATLADYAFGSERTIFLAFPGIVDGVTMRDDIGNSFRLYGIHLPDEARECMADEKIVPCRDMAHVMLERFTSSTLTCHPTHQSGKVLTVRCRDYMGRDVAGRMVASGWAEPDRTTAQDYIFEAMEAKARRLGIWEVLKTARR